MTETATTEVQEMRLARDTANGALKPGLLPGATGWYWTQRPGFLAPEVVHVMPPDPRVAPTGKVRALTGEFDLIGTDYGHPDTRWYGPFQAPLGWDRFNDK